MEEIIKEITSTQNLIIISMVVILIHMFINNIQITDKLTDIEKELQKTRTQIEKNQTTSNKEKQNDNTIR